MPKGAAKNIDEDGGLLCPNHGHDDDVDDGNGCQKRKMNDHDEHMHEHTSSSSTHMDLSVNLFFNYDDLKIGEKFPLYFPFKNPSKIPHFIPKEEADSIPFSLSQLPQILEFFSFSQDSPQAKAIKDTLESCELPPIKGESKSCATSLESVLDFLGQFFGVGTNFKVFTTTQMKNWTTHLQNYTILEDPKEILTAHMVGCHPLPYPYALFYCHGQKESHNKLFAISFEGEDGVKIEAIAICHMDTSQWEPDHPSFRVLGIEPGASPVCHILPQDSLVWVSSPSSVE